MGETILPPRSKAEQVSDWIACAAGSGPSSCHVVWFGAWVAVNAGAVRGIRPFDPFPSLTMTSPSRPSFWRCSSSPARPDLDAKLTAESLDLQIDLLAEREKTAVLQLLQHRH